MGDTPRAQLVASLRAAPCPSTRGIPMGVNRESVLLPVPSPRVLAGRGLGRGASVADERRPLTPTLSPLPRGEGAFGSADSRSVPMGVSPHLLPHLGAGVRSAPHGIHGHPSLRSQGPDHRLLLGARIVRLEGGGCRSGVGGGGSGANVGSWRRRGGGTCPRAQFSVARYRSSGRRMLLATEVFEHGGMSPLLAAPQPQ